MGTSVGERREMVWKQKSKMKGPWTVVEVNGFVGTGRGHYVAYLSWYVVLFHIIT